MTGVPLPSVDAMRTPDGVRVSPARLRAAGGELRRAGRDLAGGLRRAGQPLAGAASGCPGWVAAADAVEAARAWRDLLDDLAGQVDALGRAFATAADGYASCDERAAERTGGVVRW